MAKSAQLLITCEHGGNKVPARYRQYFRGHEDLLKTHRGYDAGALVMAQELATAFNAPLFFSTTSRLLIDLNRSIGHPHLYSEATRAAPDEVHREMLEQYYLPYRSQAEAAIAKMLAQGSQVIHIASHSFTPQLDGEVRNADIGLLYDPARRGEAALCGRWAAILKSQVAGCGNAEQVSRAARSARSRAVNDETYQMDRRGVSEHATQQSGRAVTCSVFPFKIRRNYPYTGRSDGFTAYLRRQFSADDYIGVELELNQKHVIAGGRGWRVLRELVIETLQQALADSEI